LLLLLVVVVLVDDDEVNPERFSFTSCWADPGRKATQIRLNVPSDNPQPIYNPTHTHMFDSMQKFSKLQVSLFGVNESNLRVSLKEFKKIWRAILFDDRKSSISSGMTVKAASGKGFSIDLQNNRRQVTKSGHRKQSLSYNFLEHCKRLLNEWRECQECSENIYR
jgi:hypothetical protein